MSQFKEFTYPVQIKEKHLDTFGHVNNATYLELYEEARWELISENGFGLKEIQQEKKGPVILDIAINFKSELLNRQIITIHTQLSSIKGKIMFMNQKMVKEDGTVASEARFTVGLMDMKLRKLIEPTEEWLKACGV